MRIGILFADHDVAVLKSRQLDAVAIAPACPVDEEAIADTLAVPVINLNDLIEKGEMSSLSRKCAHFIRQALRDIDLPTEALASQNDLYQYHLRKQYLFQTAFARFLNSGDAALDGKPILVFPFKRLARYESPMRPELEKLFRDFRTFGFLASILADQRGIPCEFTDRVPGTIAQLVDKVTLAARHFLIHGYMLVQLTRKTLAARGQSCKPLTVGQAAVGIIVRTDSEVISAKALIDALAGQGIKTLIIQDELLASETTALRLDALGLSYVSIGATTGLQGLIIACTALRQGDRKRIAREIEFNLRADGDFMAVSYRRWASWIAERLFDFSLSQRHFSSEVSALIQSHHLRLLVTFAYVDQWGPVVQRTGQKAGIKTVCVQNAAQDPEEYPRLSWSDHYCVESRYLKKELMALGFPSDKISATGLPHYIGGAIGQEDMASTADKSTILLITQPIYESYYLSLIEWLSRYCAAKNCSLAIKYHPRQVGDEYYEAIETAKALCPVTIFHREELGQSLSDAKLCISVVSAAILTAINRGVPTISFLPKSEKYLDLYYCSERNLFVAQTIDALRDVLDQANDDFPAFWAEFKKRRLNYLENHLTIEPSDASAHNILEVLNAHLN